MIYVLLGICLKVSNLASVAHFSIFFFCELATRELNTHIFLLSDTLQDLDFFMEAAPKGFTHLVQEANYKIPKEHTRVSSSSFRRNSSFLQGHPGSFVRSLIATLQSYLVDAVDALE